MSSKRNAYVTPKPPKRRLNNAIYSLANQNGGRRCGEKSASYKFSGWKRLAAKFRKFIAIIRLSTNVWRIRTLQRTLQCGLCIRLACSTIPLKNHISNGELNYTLYIYRILTMQLKLQSHGCTELCRRTTISLDSREASRLSSIIRIKIFASRLGLLNVNW